MGETNCTAISLSTVDASADVPKDLGQVPNLWAILEAPA
jgi:hypothetical protein